MADKKKSLKVVQGGREAHEAQKAQEIVKALLVDKDRETAFQIADTLARRGELTLSAVKQRKPD